MATWTVISLQDRGAPHTVDTEFNDAKFDVKLAADDPTAIKLVQQPGADGFSMDIQPLFQVIINNLSEVFQQTMW